MLPRASFLIFTALLLAAPTGAAMPECAKNPSDDSTFKSSYPLSPGVYVVVDNATDSGFWTETNGVDGLQMSSCYDSNGLLWYAHDAYNGTNVPANSLL